MDGQLCDLSTILQVKGSWQVLACSVYPLLYLPKKELQCGQLCSTFMHSFIQQGIRQHPIQHPRRHIINPESQATSEGEVFVVVSTSAWQCGHIICVDCDPKGTTVVTTVVGAPAWKGVNGA